MEPHHIRHHLDRAIRTCGSAAELARQTGVVRASISKARKNGRVSPAMAVSIELATKGRVHRSVFHPELWDAPHGAAQEESFRA